MLLTLWKPFPLGTVQVLGHLYSWRSIENGVFNYKKCHLINNGLSLGKIVYISSCSLKAWTEQRARRNYDCAKPMNFAVTHLFILLFVFWKNYSSYEMPAFGSDPPWCAEGPKLSRVCGLIWEFSSPGCARLGANNSAPHLRTGES